MEGRDFGRENADSRRELAALTARLDEHSFSQPVGSGWTTAGLLCHLAFWDQRVLHLLRQWQTGPLEPVRLSPQHVDSLNAAVKLLALAVPATAAVRLALDSAEAVDAEVSRLTDDLVERMIAAGCERYLWRSIHRREHIRQIKEALEAGA